MIMTASEVMESQPRYAQHGLQWIGGEFWDNSLVGGWPTPSEKYEFVSWEDDIPNINGKIKKMFRTTNQIN